MARSKQTPPPPALHELEAEVMEEVWRHEEISVREVMEHLNAARSQAARVHDVHDDHVPPRWQGIAEPPSRGEGGPLFAPSTARDEYRELRARSEVQALVSEFGDVALAHFARQMNALDPDRLKELRRLARKSE